MGTESRYPPRMPRHTRPGGRALCALLALPALGLLPGKALAQADTTTDMQAVMLEPGSMINVAEMDFGRIAQPLASGTVTLTPSASATCTVTGGLVRVGVCQAAAFGVYGRKNWRVRLRTASNTVLLTGPGGATMTMSNITFAASDMSPTSGAGAGWNLGRYEIDSNDGLAVFYLGGRLTVAAAQALGVYNGTLVIEAQFN